MKKSFSLLALLLLAFFLGLLAPQAAFAGVDDNCRSSSFPSSPVVLGNAKSSVAVGSAIPGSDTFNSYVINCPSNWSDLPVALGTSCTGSPNWSLMPAGSVLNKTAYPGVYTTTGMPAGIGYELLDDAGTPLPLDSAGRHDMGVRIQTDLQTVPVHLRLVKIADSIADASFTLQLRLGCADNEWANKSTNGSTIKFKVTTKTMTQTCNMLVSDLQVPLPLVNTTNFTGVGSAAGGKPSVLEFQCDANANAQVNFTDATEPGNAGDTLKLLGGSSATGVGVRLTIDGNPVMLSPNEAFHSGGTEVPLQNTTAASAVEQIPFSAEYVQTGPSVTPGTVQARSLVNISYN